MVLMGFLTYYFLNLANYESKAVGCVRVTHAIVQMGFPHTLNKIIIFINSLVFYTNLLLMEVK